MGFMGRIAVVALFLATFAALYDNRENPDAPSGNRNGAKLHGHYIQEFDEQVDRLARKGGWPKGNHRVHSGEGNKTVVSLDVRNESFNCWLRLQLVPATDNNPLNDKGASYVPVALVHRDGKKLHWEMPLSALPPDISRSLTVPNMPKSKFVQTVEITHINQPGQLGMCMPKKN